MPTVVSNAGAYASWKTTSHSCTVTHLHTQADGPVPHVAAARCLCGVVVDVDDLVEVACDHTGDLSQLLKVKEALLSVKAANQLLAVVAGTLGQQKNGGKPMSAQYVSHTRVVSPQKRCSWVILLVKQTKVLRVAVQLATSVGLHSTRLTC